ncbi:reticulon-2 isoform X1 [Zootoca vivipara]|uniref:reticulon-2 isoform X1 n=1 Tax=Zootoca vivipara TaxID=8524 RepID=UPI001591525B|nr:reticulon-2 isoform X1 [Zootoca vivipara]
MGQVLGFAHCKESPSTASTTPDSTDGGNDESDFPELQTAREFSEDEEDEEVSLEWGTPRELTFSYITIAGPLNSSPPLGEHAPRGRRDSQTRRARGPLPRTDTCETFVPALGDSLENIPSLCPSPEGEGEPPPADSQGLDTFLGWEAHAGSVEEADQGEGEGAQGSQRHSTVAQALEEGQSSSSSRSSESSSDTSLEDLPPSDALAPHPESGAPCGADTLQHPSLTSSEFCQHPLWDEEVEQREEEEEQEEDLEPISEQRQAEPDQSGNTLEKCPVVADLVYWRDTRKSAFVFTALMVALLCLLHFSIISVASYLSLAALSVTISLRVYSKILLAIHRGEGHNPFQAQLDADLGLSKEQLERLTERVTFYVTSGTKSLQRLFLVDDLVESIKFAFLFYILTYVGAVFNGLTLLILGVISAFTFPLLYRQHQAQIDQYVGLVRNQLSNLRAKVLSKLPTAKAKAE